MWRKSTIPEKTPQERRRETNSVLESIGIRPVSDLPLTETSSLVTLRSKEETVRRAVSLLLISLYAEGICTGEDRVRHRGWIEEHIMRFRADSFFSPAERAFLDKEIPGRTESVQFSWQYEPLAVMFWALGFLDKEDALFVPAGICDVPKVALTASAIGGYRAYLMRARLRGKEEILDQADLFFCYDWACLAARIQDQGGIETEHGVVFERHRALNWLVCHRNGAGAVQGWDDALTMSL